MATSWTQDDITALEDAIKSGYQRVRFLQGEVQFQSITEMLKLLETMQTTVNSASGTTEKRTTYAVFRKG